LAYTSSLAPVQTILPEANTKAVAFGFFSLIITAANLRGLYSAFLAWREIFFRFSKQPRFTVATMFCNLGVIIS